MISWSELVITYMMIVNWTSSMMSHPRYAACCHKCFGFVAAVHCRAVEQLGACLPQVTFEADIINYSSPLSKHDFEVAIKKYDISKPI